MLFRPRNEVLRATKEVSDRGLQGLLVNLRAQDRDRDGVLSTDMVKGSLKKFQVTTKIEKKKCLCIPEYTQFSELRDINITIIISFCKL